MRSDASEAKIRRFMAALASRVRGHGVVYFTGGASAVLLGFRATTLDVDLKLDPEPEGAFEALARLKDELDLNVELASPDDFIPPLPGWKDRSRFIESFGAVEYRHYDFRAQALAKIERGHAQDTADVDAMVRGGLVDSADLRSDFERIAPGLVRYPAIDADSFRIQVDAFARRHEGPRGRA